MDARNSVLAGNDTTTLPSFLASSIVLSHSEGGFAGCARTNPGNSNKPEKSTMTVFAPSLIIELLCTDVIEPWHLGRHAELLDGDFEIDANLRIFVFVLDHRAALAHASANSFFVYGAPTTEQIFTRLAAVAKRQLAGLLVAGIEMLMEPAARRAEDAAFAPIDLHDLISVT